MKKISAFFIAAVLFIIIVIVYNNILDNQIEQHKNRLYYYLGETKFDSIKVAEVCLNNKESDNILVLGSSELSTYNNKITNKGNSNFNMYLVGRGRTQSLQSAITLGGISNSTNINKVVLIISPQWFEESGNLTPDVFASRFQRDMFNKYIQNEKITEETKQKILEIVKQLEKTDALALQEIEIYEKEHLGNLNILDRIGLGISESIRDTKQKKELIEQINNLKETPAEINKVDFSNYNFETLLNIAQKQGEMECTNNEFGIYDEYFDTYIKNGVAYKNKRKDEDFLNDNEYRDLEIFLQTCQELKIKPLIINVPVNGRWYDNVGIEQAKREKYYNKILNITQKYNAQVADFSDCEYEKYFLKDIMHLGWKGWIKVDEAIYKFYKEQ